MLSISAVAAVESNTTDDVIAGEVDEEPPSGAVQDVSNNNTIGVTNDNLEKAAGDYELSGNDLKMYYKNGSSYDVTLRKNSKPVKNASLSIVLNGVTYNNSIGGQAIMPQKLTSPTTLFLWSISPSEQRIISPTSRAGSP